MSSIFKEAAKKLPYPLFLRIFYAWFFLGPRRRFESNRRRGGFARLTQEDLEQRKTSDTLFVLGSGPSINQISGERWQAIARHDSVGFNFWVFHPFVPKMYFMESIYRERDRVTDRYLEKYDACVRARGAEYGSTLKVVSGLHERGRHHVWDWPGEWKEGFKAVCDLPGPARTEREFERMLRYLGGRGAFAGWARLPYLFKHASSVTTMIALGLRMGYRKIVLCGIDLGVHQYFYQDPELYPGTACLEFYPRSAELDILAPVPWRIPADVVICAMKRELLDPAGVELYVENRSSKLWPAVPEAPDSIFE
ncbi:MAG: hypothetical protein ACRD2K_01205 [Terriglobales bacterium]